MSNFEPDETKARQSDYPTASFNSGSTPFDKVEVIPPDQLSDRESEALEEDSQPSNLAVAHPLDMFEVIPADMLSDREGSEASISGDVEDIPWTEEHDIFAYGWITISAGEITMEELRLRLSLVPSWPSRSVAATAARYANVWAGPKGLKARLDSFTDREAPSLGYADISPASSALGEDSSDEEA